MTLLKKIPFAFMLLLTAPGLRAAGMEVPFISVSALGTANAGAVEADDAATQYFNPAGMALLKPGTQVSQPFGLVFAGGKVTNDVSNQGGTQAVSSYGSPDNAQDGRYVDGRSSSKFLPAVLPLGALFVSRSVDDMITVGLGMFSPGGGVLNYKGDYFGRYFFKSGDVELANINPAISIRFDDKHSVGLGASVVGGHARFMKSDDPQGAAPYISQGVIEHGNAAQLAGLGSVLSAANPGLSSVIQGLQAGIAYNSLPDSVRGQINSAAGSALLDPSSTVSAQVDMWGLGLGFNLGYLYQISDTQRIGFSYRSQSTVHMRGELEWDLSNLRSKTPGLEPVLFDNMSLSDYVARNVHPDTKARLDLIIPAKFDMAYFVSVSPKVDLMANWQFNKTSSLQSSCVNFSDVAGGMNGSVHQGPACLDLKARDSSTFSLGMNYHVDDKLTLRTGAQYDQTPVPSAKYRTPGAPDNNRLLLAFGANYRLAKNTSLDFAYAYMMVQDGASDYHDRCRNTYYEGTPSSSNNCSGDGGTFRGLYTGVHAQIIGAQLNKKF